MKIDIFDEANAGKYGVIYADPPWSYKQGGRGAAAKHYQTMDNSAIKNLPVEKLAAKDAVLFMWATFPNLPQALETIKAWGFEYKTLGFNWVKETRGGGVAVLGPGILDTQQPRSVPAGDERKAETGQRVGTQRDRSAGTAPQPKAGRSKGQNSETDGRDPARGTFRQTNGGRLGLLGERSVTEEEAMSKMRERALRALISVLEFPVVTVGLICGVFGLIGEAVGLIGSGIVKGATIIVKWLESQKPEKEN